MGTASIVLGLVSICTCWIPVFGWLSAFMGLLGCAFGIPSITHWFHKPGYTPWGISGLIVGVPAAEMSLAYQIKYAGGALYSATVAVDPIAAVVFSVGAIGLSALGLFLARKKNRTAGILLAATALIALIAVGTSALVTADMKYEAAALHLPS